MEVRPRKPGIVFVIIHGTASSKARWIRPDSKIRRRLERHFDRQGHSVSFLWSGANTDAARLTAGKDLGRRILELYEEFHAPIYLVAHSHGGYIALYAMRDPAVEEKVAGVICMATLFMKCTPRAFIPAVEKCVNLAPRVAGAAALGLLALLPPTGMAGWTAALLAGLLAVTRTLWMPGYNHFRDRWVDRLRGPANAISAAAITTLSLPKLPNVKMLCLASPSDEVSKCLRLSIFLTEIPFYAWRCLNKISDLVTWDKGGPSKVLAITFYIGVCAAIACMFHADHWLPWLHSLRLLVLPRLAGLLMLAVMPPLLSILQLILVVTPNLPGVLYHNFGGESIFDHWFTRFTVSPAPEGPTDCIVKHMNVASGRPNLFAPNLRTFMAFTAHTRLYHNREVLREIMRWIYQKEFERRRMLETAGPDI